MPNPTSPYAGLDAQAKVLAGGKAAIKKAQAECEANGWEVPLALWDLKGSRAMRESIRAARSRAENVSGGKSRFERALGRERRESAKKKNILADRVEHLDTILQPAGEAPSLDGLRVGQKADGTPEDPNKTTLDFEVLPSMVDFFNDTSSDTWLVIGPAGSGKTSHSCMKLLKHCSLHPNGARYLILRLTYPQLRDTTINSFFQWIPRSLGKWNAEEKKFTLGGKYEFLFRACERPEDVDSFKGIEYTGYFINEAMEVPREIKEMLDQRLGRYPKEKYSDENGIMRERGTDKTIQILDTNPPDMEHWLVRDFIKNPLDGHKHVFNPAFENAHNLPKGYYERMKASYRDNPDLADRYIYGKLGSTYRGKRVYPEYDQAVHLAKSPIKPMAGLPIHVGLDFGSTPTALYAQVWPDGRLVMVGELNSENTGISQFSEMMNVYQRNGFPDFEFFYYGDPAGARRSETDYTSPFEILAEKGIFVTPGPVAIPVRINAVKERLRMRNGMVISPVCTRLIDGFGGGYVYKKIPGLIQGQELYTDKPDKGKTSHVHDCCQYICACLFGNKERDEEAELLRRFTEDSKAVESMVGY